MDSIIDAKRLMYWKNPTKLIEETGGDASKFTGGDFCSILEGFKYTIPFVDGYKDD